MGGHSLLSFAAVFGKGTLSIQRRYRFEANNFREDQNVIF